MPITTQAKKALATAEHKKVFNLRRKRTMKSAVKDVRDLALSGSIKEAEAKIPVAYKAIDKATKLGVIKKHTAARKKSGLARLVSKSG